MILAVVTSLIYSNKRRTVMEVFSPSVRKLWKEWDLRLMVVLSLVLQILLIILGHRRKYKQSLLIRAVVWSAYLAADSTAIFALGILSNNLTDIYFEQARSLDANSELTALWAPFLLLHLGGPDTITAYSLEDNELWPRHFVGLVVQTIITFYVFLLTWTGSLLSILFILMFLAGFIKYGERNYALRSASLEKLRESMFTPPQFGPRDTEIFSAEKETKITEGYKAREDVVPDNQLSVDLSVFTSNKSLSTEDKLLTVSGVLDVTKRLFLNIMLDDRESDRTKSVFRNMSAENAFEVVETELGLIYDLLYTKAELLRTRWGLALRGITFLVICSVLVVFTFLAIDNKSRYSKIDVTITFLLLIVAIIVEVYSALLLIFSDQFLIWLSKHNRTSFPKSKKSWSHQMSQWSLLHSFTSEEPRSFLAILKLLKIDKELQKRSHEAFHVSRAINNLIFRCIMEKVLQEDQRRYNKSMGNPVVDGNISFKVVPTARGGPFIPGRGGPDGDGAPRINVELGNSILFWHIVTEVSYKLDRGKQQFEDIVEHCKLIKHTSRYMGYLLVMYPSLLSVGADKIRLHKTIDRAIDELRGAADKIQREDRAKKLEWRQKKTQAYEKLVKFEAPVDGSSPGWNKLLYDALKFADSLSDEMALTRKWNTIGSNWLNMLFLAAKRSDGKEHAQQLRRGGELFTHVWLLMAHFGLTSHFDEMKKGGNGNENRNVDRVIAKKGGASEMLT